MIQRSACLMLAVLVFTGAAWAQDGARDWAKYYDDRWYIQAQGGMIFSDSSDLDNGPAGYFTIGRPILPWLSLELEAGYADLGVPAPATDYERFTAGVNAVVYLLRGPNVEDVGGFRPFLMAGANMHDIDFLDESTTGPGLQFGGGFTYPLSRSLEFIASGRYHIDQVNAEPPGIPRDEDFYTWTALFGVRLKLGEFPPDSDADGIPDHRDECPNTPPGVTVDQYGCPIDSDGDGVPDHKDRCPGTPEGATVDQYGCPIDSDGDGVPDYLDECPNTPEGERVDQRGCPFTDSDNDGVSDFKDKCPNTPPGIPVDADGCPLDSDGDGVPDHLDECPQSPPGATVLPNGCALVGDRRLARPGEPADAEGFAVERTQNFILRGVNFEFDSARLTPESKDILDQAAEVLKAYPDVDVDVEGHTDSIGPDEYNLGLSERRANSVKTYLMQKDISGGRMTPVGYGETIPIDTNDTEEGRANNRRVEFRVR